MNLVETFCKADNKMKLVAGVILTDLLSYSWDRFCFQKNLDVSSALLNKLSAHDQFSCRTRNRGLQTEKYLSKNFGICPGTCIVLNCSDN